MDTESLRRLQVIQLDKERGELNERLRVTGKRIDHFERALRREEIPLLEKDYEEQLAHESKIYEQNKQQKLALAAARHKESINLKKRLERIMPDYQVYRKVIEEKKSEEFEARLHEARQALEAEKSRRLAEFQKYQDEQRRIREEKERQEEMEREKKRKEEEEARAKEEAVRKEAEERQRIRLEERRYEPYITSNGSLIRLGDSTNKPRNRDNENGKSRNGWLLREHKPRRPLPLPHLNPLQQS